MLWRKLDNLSTLGVKRLAGYPVSEIRFLATKCTKYKILAVLLNFVTVFICWAVANICRFNALWVLPVSALIGVCVYILILQVAYYKITEVRLYTNIKSIISCGIDSFSICTSGAKLEEVLGSVSGILDDTLVYERYLNDKYALKSWETDCLSVMSLSCDSDAQYSIAVTVAKKEDKCIEHQIIVDLKLSSISN